MIFPALLAFVTGVTFHTSDPAVQGLYDAAAAKVDGNLVQFTPALQILVEGGGYTNAWIETQPLGGEMYAKRDIQVGLNNQRLFMLGQRPDGRLPGMIIGTETAIEHGWDRSPPGAMAWIPQGHFLADYQMLQGYCFPDPAWKLYFWAGKDRAYLQQLYSVLEAHDRYLWRTRAHNPNGVLETWCIWDTGEDGSSRLVTRGASNNWPFETPPSDFRGGSVPFESMDLMGYSYDGRNTLAKIAPELGNGKEADWRAQAEAVRRSLAAHLWNPQRGACFDRDRYSHTLPELIHNNLRVMYHGAFSQEMADTFIREHLLNPAEFWTPVPLVSIAANEPLYQSIPSNNWSGQPQGLTYQRAIRALENYGHYAEVTLLARKLLPVLIRNGDVFGEQLDSITGAGSGPKPDGYGPMILSALEYLGRTQGIQLNVESGEVWWSMLTPAGQSLTTTQRWGDRTWTLTVRDGQCEGRLNGRLLFTATAGERIVTDLDGHIRAIVGIDSEPRRAKWNVGRRSHSQRLFPNQISATDLLGAVRSTSRVPFDFPHR